MFSFAHSCVARARSISNALEYAQVLAGAEFHIDDYWIFVTPFLVCFGFRLACILIFIFRSFSEIPKHFAVNTGDFDGRVIQLSDLSSDGSGSSDRPVCRANLGFGDVPFCELSNRVGLGDSGGVRFWHGFDEFQAVNLDVSGGAYNRPLCHPRNLRDCSQLHNVETLGDVLRCAAAPNQAIGFEHNCGHGKAYEADRYAHQAPAGGFHRYHLHHPPIVSKFPGRGCPQLLQLNR